MLIWLAGIKYRFDDLRNSLERSSARETTMRVAVGAVAKRLLEEIGVQVASHIVNFGGIEVEVPENLNSFPNQGSGRSVRSFHRQSRARRGNQGLYR